MKTKTITTYKGICPELKIRLKRDQIVKRKIQSSKHADEFFREVWDDGMDIYESFMVVFINSAYNTIGWYKVSQGGLNYTSADPRLIFKMALDVCATGLYMAHNHPSGNMSPSQVDKMLTEKLKQAGALLDIRIMDHVIITSENGYYSFADEGML